MPELKVPPRTVRKLEALAREGETPSQVAVRLIEAAQMGTDGHLTQQQCSALDRLRDTYHGINPDITGVEP